VRVQSQVVLRDLLKEWLPSAGLAPYFQVDQNATTYPKDRKWFVWLCRKWWDNDNYYPMWAMLQINDDHVKTNSTYPEQEFKAADPKFFQRVKAYLLQRKLDFAHEKLDTPLHGNKNES
jgi:hypothetical protein